MKNSRITLSQVLPGDVIRVSDGRADYTLFMVSRVEFCNRYYWLYDLEGEMIRSGEGKEKVTLRSREVEG